MQQSPQSPGSSPVRPTSPTNSSNPTHWLKSSGKPVPFNQHDKLLGVITGAIDDFFTQALIPNKKSGYRPKTPPLPPSGPSTGGSSTYGSSSSGSSRSKKEIKAFQDQKHREMNPELVEKRHAVAADKNRTELINQADSLAKEIESIDKKIMRLKNSTNKTEQDQEHIKSLEKDTSKKTTELTQFLDKHKIRLNDERLNRIITG